MFAPTDDAFAKIPKADLDKVLADKDQLTKILTYHVVGQKLMPSAHRRRLPHPAAAGAARPRPRAPDLPHRPRRRRPGAARLPRP
ncbi:fasciclin domain-containing protein [Streptomyces sp. NPDC047706]|uniref:fasciclin domain-containing protein n=1 Tax=Streptomyces sp. NPDC047706 TaxID=3365486 RepID=UPI0037106ABD